jgi:DNA-binding beta-propeller fold protein YncE
MLASIPTGIEPKGMAVSPDEQTIVNTSETTNMAHFIDYKSRRSWRAFCRAAEGGDAADAGGETAVHQAGRGVGARHQ